MKGIQVYSNEETLHLAKGDNNKIAKLVYVIPSFGNVCLHELSFLRDGIYKLPVKVYSTKYKYIFSLSSFLMAPLNNSGMDLPISRS